MILSMRKMIPGLIQPLNEDASWHLAHGAVYQVYRDDVPVAIFWLTPMPENMCVFHYAVYPEIGCSIIKVGLYVRKWLLDNYFAVIGTIDIFNPKSLRLAQHMRFRIIHRVQVEPGRFKYLVILEK